MKKINTRIELHRGPSETAPTTEIWVFYGKSHSAIGFLEPIDIEEVVVMFREMANRIEKDLKDE